MFLSNEEFLRDESHMKAQFSFRNCVELKMIPAALL
jgi:hypothetical protein